jgi:hypothetical protein
MDDKDVIIARQQREIENLRELVAQLRDEIARAPSFGMNITFARMGYSFAGRLINNTNIGGQFEDMNVWHKNLSATTE